MFLITMNMNILKKTFKERVYLLVGSLNKNLSVVELMGSLNFWHNLGLFWNTFKKRAKRFIEK